MSNELHKDVTLSRRPKLHWLRLCYAESGVIPPGKTPFQLNL